MEARRARRRFDRQTEHWRLTDCRRCPGLLGHRNAVHPACLFPVARRVPPASLHATPIAWTSTIPSKAARQPWPARIRSASQSRYSARAARPEIQTCPLRPSTSPTPFAFRYSLDAMLLPAPVNHPPCAPRLPRIHFRLPARSQRLRSLEAAVVLAALVVFAVAAALRDRVALGTLAPKCDS